jgi:hypothetical protein
MQESTYFTATLAHAALHNREHPHGISTIPQLLEARAISHPLSQAVGFSIPNSLEKWGSKTLSKYYQSLFEHLHSR